MTGAYGYQITAPPIPPDVTGLTAVQVGETAIMRWQDTGDQSVQGYDISFSKSTDGSNIALPLSEVTRATEMTTANIPPGNWNVWIVARNSSDDVSENTAFATLGITNTKTVVTTKSYIPCYHTPVPDASFAGLSLLFQHWTGKFIPKSVNKASFYHELPAPDVSNFTLDYVPGGNFDDTTYYFKATYVFESGETTPSAEMSIFVPAGNLPTIFYDGATGGYHAWNIYVSDSSGAETLQNADLLGLNSNLEIWQMPITGLVSGASPPTKNQSGWDVFNIFVPDCVQQFYFIPDAGAIDLGSSGNRRAWLSIDLRPGPGEPALDQKNWSQTFHILGQASTPVTFGGSSDIMSMIGAMASRYVMPYIMLQSSQPSTGIRQSGSVCYINSLSITIDQ